VQRIPGLASRTVLRIGDSFEAALAAQPRQLAFDPRLAPDRIAALFHTGGTTGAPKLVQHTHGNEAHTAWFAHRFYDFDENAIEVNGFPLFHVAGAFVYGLSLLAIGATQVLPTASGMRNTGFMRSYWKFCERERVSALACVPTILAGLCNLPVDADISRVRVAYTGGSPLPSELGPALRGPVEDPRAQHPGHDRVRGAGLDRAAGRAARAGLRRPATAVHRGARARRRRDRAARSACEPGLHRPGAQCRHVRRRLGWCRATWATSTRRATSTSPAAPRT
jgi:fatty-acyl-CoA synthase